MTDTDAELFILAIAFGTRGDIVPILSVLHGIIHRANDVGPTAHLLILTHRCFQEDIKAYLPNFVDVVGVDISPIVTQPNKESKFRGKHDLDEILSSLEVKEVDLIVSNLFGLEAWGLALKKNVPYDIIHPNCPDANMSAKAELLGDFRAKYVHECNLLCSRTEKTNGVRWSDIDLWLWPTLVNLDFHMVERIVSYNKSITVLILSSPMFEKELGWTEQDRYHLCGFAGDGYLSKYLHLEASNHLYDNIEPVTPSPCLYKACYTLQEILQSTRADSDSNEASDLICVDFGSMTQVLNEKGELAVLLRVLCNLCDTWRFVIVCHGYMTTMQNILHEIANDSSSATAAISATSAAAATAATTSTVNTRIWLLPNSVQHSVLFPKCITTIHHGGIGTTGACMRAGIPQLILSVMYDQHRNGQRVEELKLGFTSSIDSITNSSDSSDTVNVEASVYRLRVVLTKCTSPAQRLRCACVGQKKRSDPAEDGITNAVELLWGQISHIVPSKKIEIVENKSGAETQQLVYETDPEGLLVLPNGLKMHAHWKSAPEETAFLYGKIFERQVYARGVAQLRPGDLVVDVGANVGMFALYAAHHTQMLNQDPITIIAIEPMQANFTLLQQNMHLYKVRGRCYRCAVGTSAEEPIGTKEKNAALVTLSDSMAVFHDSYDPDETRDLPTNSKTMLYYPRMPGNSCNIERVASNTALQEAHMNPKVLHEAQSDCAEETCAVFTLPDVLDHFLQFAEDGRGVNKSTYFEDDEVVGMKRPADGVRDAASSVAARRVALLKIDVEGDELEVLQSINKPHWVLIDRVIIESHPNNTDGICALLLQEGFCEGNISVEEDGTGNSFVYTSRF